MERHAVNSVTYNNMYHCEGCVHEQVFVSIWICQAGKGISNVLYLHRISWNSYSWNLLENLDLKPFWVKILVLILLELFLATVILLILAWYEQWRKVFIILFNSCLKYFAKWTLDCSYLASFGKEWKGKICPKNM